MLVTSKDNENIKHVKKLKEKKYRDEFGEYIIEGINLIKEAIQENIEIRTIFICDGCMKTEDIEKNLIYNIASLNCIYVDEKIFNTITDVETPQGVLAVVSKKQNKKLIDYKKDLIVILDGIQDPGNLGTILRTADSCNLSQIILSKKTVDVFNPKVVRSTMGAIFRVNVLESNNLTQTIKEIKKHKFNVYATALSNSSKSIYDVNYKKSAIIIGNESNGVSKEVLEIVDEKITIPMLGKTESLNASVATGIVLYEYIRQSIKK
jgi:TrmH family RNA methyltransferase